jgi:hypothetical protein
MSDPSKPVTSFSSIINDALDQQSDGLSPSVVQELQAARKQALIEHENSLAAVPNNAPKSWWGRLLERLLAALALPNRSTYAFASFASIMVVAVVLLTVKSPGIMGPSSDINGSATTLAMLDEELSEDVEMLSDLEFAYWLAETSLDDTDVSSKSGDAS